MYEVCDACEEIWSRIKSNIDRVITLINCLEFMDSEKIRMTYKTLWEYECNYYISPTEVIGINIK